MAGNLISVVLPLGAAAQHQIGGTVITRQNSQVNCLILFGSRSCVQEACIEGCLPHIQMVKNEFVADNCMVAAQQIFIVPKKASPPGSDKIDRYLFIFAQERQHLVPQSG